MKPVLPNAVTGQIMHLSVREVRMIVERILLTTGLPDGFVPAVRDCVLYSQAMGLGGMGALKRDYDLLKSAQPASMKFAFAADGVVELDAAGQHAWVVAPNLIDLVLAEARTGRHSVVRVRDVAEVPELALLRGYGGRFGAELDINIESGRIAIGRLIGDRLDRPDEILNSALTHGMPVPKLLWEELYAKSHEALTPDSIASRRHAGPVMVDEQGRLHGRDDDDTDFALLGVKPARPAPENA